MFFQDGGDYQLRGEKMDTGPTVANVNCTSTYMPPHTIVRFAAIKYNEIPEQLVSLRDLAHSVHSTSHTSHSVYSTIRT